MLLLMVVGDVVALEVGHVHDVAAFVADADVVGVAVVDYIVDAVADDVAAAAVDLDVFGC